MLVKGKRKVFGTEFRDYYRKATKNDKRKLDRTDNEKNNKVVHKKISRENYNQPFWSTHKTNRLFLCTYDAI